MIVFNEMKRKLSIIIFSIVTLVGCQNNPTSFNVSIDDAAIAKTDTLRIIVEDGQWVERVKVKISGVLDDTASLEPWFLLSGKVDTSFRTDWYQSDFILNYEPLNAQNGNLKVEVHFVVY